MELIPAIDLMGGKVVRLIRGNPQSATVYRDDPVATALQWAAAGADAIHLVDLDAALGISDGAPIDLISQITRELSIPVQVGGGVRTPRHVADLFSAGAQRAVVGTMAFQDQDVLEEVVRKVGADRIIVALDYADGKVKIEGWQESTLEDPLEALERLRRLSVRQFLMTAISHDGTMAGADIEMLEAASRVADGSIYASGGVATLDDIRRLIRIGVKGVILGKALYERTLTIEQIRRVIDGD